MIYYYAKSRMKHTIIICIKHSHIYLPAPDIALASLSLEFAAIESYLHFLNAYNTATENSKTPAGNTTTTNNSASKKNDNTADLNTTTLGINIEVRRSFTIHSILQFIATEEDHSTI